MDMKQIQASLSEFDESTLFMMLENPDFINNDFDTKYLERYNG